jgi:hypothetical protein
LTVETEGGERRIAEQALKIGHDSRAISSW